MAPALRVLFAATFAMSALAGDESPSQPDASSPWQPNLPVFSGRRARELPSSEQLAQIRQVVELVRQSRDQLPADKLAQLSQQLAQLRARISASRNLDSASEVGSPSSPSLGSTDPPAAIEQRAGVASGGQVARSTAHPEHARAWYPDLGMLTLDPTAPQGPLFYDEVSVNEATYNTIVSGPPHDSHMYGTPKPRAAPALYTAAGVHTTPAEHGADSAGRHPHSTTVSSHGGNADSAKGQRITGYGPPKAAAFSSQQTSFGKQHDVFESPKLVGPVVSDPAASATTSRTTSMYDPHAHWAQGQLFHDNYIRNGPDVVPHGAPHNSVYGLPHGSGALLPLQRPATLQQNGAVVFPHGGGFARPPPPVAVHIGIGHPVVGYQPPAAIAHHQEHVLAEPAYPTGGRVFFPAAGVQFSEGSYVAPPPTVDHPKSVTHVDEYVSSREVPHHQSSYESHRVVAHHAPTHAGKPLDAQAYGPPHSNAIAFSITQDTPHISQHHAGYGTPKRRPFSLFDSLMRPLKGIGNFLAGGKRHQYAKPEAAYGMHQETPALNYYEYGATAHRPRRCKCISSSSVLGLLVAGVGAAGIAAYITSQTMGASLGRAADGPDKAALARLMLEEACSLGAEQENMWNGTVWLGDDAGQGNAELAGLAADVERKELKIRKGDRQEKLNALVRSARKLDNVDYDDEDGANLQVSNDVAITNTGVTKEPTKHTQAASPNPGRTTQVDEEQTIQRRLSKRMGEEIPAGKDDMLGSASSDLHVFKFDAWDIPIRSSARDPGLQPRTLRYRPIFQAGRAQPFSPTTFGFGSGIFSRRVGVLDDAATGDATLLQGGAPLKDDVMSLSDDGDRNLTGAIAPVTASETYVRSLRLGDNADAGATVAMETSKLEGVATGAAAKATRAVGGDEFLQMLATLLPTLDLGPFQDLTHAFDPVPMATRNELSQGKTARHSINYRHRMMGLFRNMRNFFTVGLPSMMKAASYDSRCGCIPLTINNIGLVGAPVFVVIASGVVLGFLLIQSQNNNNNNNNNGRRRSEPGTATAEMADVLETLLAGEMAPPANSTEPARLRKYYRQIVAPAAARVPQLAALSGALDSTSVECGRYYMCQMAMSATSFGKPFDVGIPLLSLPVSWILKETQGGKFGQYCGSAVVGGSGQGDCALLYPSCK